MSLPFHENGARVVACSALVVDAEAVLAQAEDLAASWLNRWHDVGPEKTDLLYCRDELLRLIATERQRSTNESRSATAP